MNHLQIYNSIAEVAANIFSDPKKRNMDEPVRINDLPAEQAVATMNRVFELAGKG